MSKMVPAGPPGAVRANPAPRFARSGQMVECLRKAWLYSEKRPRDLLFTAIDRLVAERPPLMVSQLTREATSLARHLAVDTGFTFDNWDAATKAVMRTLLMADVLRSPEGEIVRFGIAAQASRVGGLQQDYRDAAEAFLLEFVIGRLGDVTTRDHTALAHALFRQFDARVPLEDLEDRLVILLARLADHVVLTNHTYEVRTFEHA